MSPEPTPALIATLETVPAEECWELLATAGFGRIGLVLDGRPEVLPVNFALDGETVVFRTAEHSALSHAATAVVCFEADHVDETSHAGWSVMVQGVATDIGDAIDPTSERIRRLSLLTWAPGDRPVWFRIRPDKVTGRRLRVVADSL